MVCFLPFCFCVLTRSLLYHIVIQNASTLSLSLYIYIQNISKATTFRDAKKLLFLREKKNALFLRNNTPATN